MKRFMIRRVATAVLAFGILFSGVMQISPVTVDQQAGDIATVHAAVAKPSKLKISVKANSASSVRVKVSWKKKSNIGLYYVLTANSAVGHRIKIEGTSGYGTGSFSHKITKIEEGIPYTYTVQAVAVDRSGKGSKVAKKYKKVVLGATATRKVASIIQANGLKKKSAFDKVKFVHNWMIKNYKYDSATFHQTFPKAMKTRKAVCQAYSATFIAFMYQLKVPCRYVKSSNGRHSWNLVKVGGKWYHVDVTNDDPSYLDSLTKKHPIYTFFLQSTSSMYRKGLAEHKFAISSYPRATSTLYDNPSCTSGFSEDMPGYGYSSSFTFHIWKNGRKIN